MKNVKKFLTGIILILFFVTIVVEAGHQWDSVRGHSFPRTYIQSWKLLPDWATNFDIIYARPNQFKNGVVAMLKTTNPAIKILVNQEDWNCVRISSGENPPSNWVLKDSKGNMPAMYGNTLGTSSCKSINISDESVRKWFAEYIVRKSNLSIFDGIATDGLHHGSAFVRILQNNNGSDVDLDNNGLNDFKEHGKGKDWVESQRNKAIKLLVSDIRNKIGNKILMINTGTGWHSLDQANITEQVNGKQIEYSLASLISTNPVGGDIYRSWNWWRQNNLSHLDKIKTPKIVLEGHGPDMWYDPKKPSGEREERNYFSFVRFGLTKAMMFGRYYMYGSLLDRKRQGEWLNNQSYNHYYDEFDLDVGYPKGKMQEIPQKKQVWVRFFDDGLAMMNMNNHQVVVSDNDIKRMTGYDGPYYKFKGGQQPIFNSGEKFGSVVLSGHGWTKQQGGNVFHYSAGDGIVLVDKPVTSVSSIIIDNDWQGTSPASDAVKLVGEWSEINADNKVDQCHNQHYEIGKCRTKNTYAFINTATAYSKSENAQAVYAPNIGVAGEYKVYEWHGKLNNTNQATNVVYKINHAKGVENKVVNQQQNQGRWNYLGSYVFISGTLGNVKINVSGADGEVVADAIKFVFNSNANYKMDFNCDNKVDIQDFAILLSHWGQEDGLSNYSHQQCENKTKMLKLSNNSSKLGVYDLGVFMSCLNDSSGINCLE